MAREFRLLPAFSIALALGLPVTVRAAPCLAEGQVATLDGRVALIAVPPSDDPPHRGYVYPRLLLDRPVCLAGRWQTAPHLAMVALQPPGRAARLAYRQGERVRETGTLWFTVTADQPPETAMMLLGRLAADAAQKRKASVER